MKPIHSTHHRVLLCAPEASDEKLEKELVKCLTVLHAVTREEIERVIREKHPRAIIIDYRHPQQEIEDYLMHYVKEHRRSPVVFGFFGEHRHQRIFNFHEKFWLPTDENRELIAQRIKNTLSKQYPPRHPKTPSKPEKLA